MLRAEETWVTGAIDRSFASRLYNNLPGQPSDRGAGSVASLLRVLMPAWQGTSPENGEQLGASQIPGSPASEHGCEE